MKEFSKKGLSFGFAVVNAGQRVVSEEPELIATSTDGGFRMSAAVSRALNIGHGEYAMFITNRGPIDTAIAGSDASLVAFCEERGLDIKSAEAATAIHKEFDVWMVAKGIEEYDKHGNPLMTKERMTKSDKVKYVANHFDEVLKAAMESDNEELVAAVSRDGITEDEQKEILVSIVEGNEVAKCKGSKCANTSAMSGAGTILNFTDSNVWAQLKEDLEDANSMNRVYTVDIEDLQDITVNNGFEDVTVKAAVIGEYKDVEPMRNKK